MAFFFVVLVLMLNVMLGYAAATLFGIGPRNVRTFVAAMLNQPVSMRGGENQICLRYNSDYQVGVEAGKRCLGMLNDRTADEGSSWGQRGNILLLNIEKLKLSVDHVQQRLMVSGLTDDSEQWTEFVDESVNDLAAGLKALSDTLSKSRRATKGELFREAGAKFRIVKALVGELNKEFSSIEFTSGKGLDAFRAFKTIYYPISVELISLLDQMESAIYRCVIDSLDDESEADFTHGDAHIESRLELERCRLEEIGEESSDKPFIGLCFVDNALACGDGYGRTTLHLALKRLNNEIVLNLPSESTKITRTANGFLVVGVAECIDEFTGVLEHLRQSIEKTTIRVGNSQIQIYVSNVVKPDDRSETTADQIEDLQKLYHEVAAFGGNRTFLCDEEAPAPVVPLELEVPSSILTVE